MDADRTDIHESHDWADHVSTGHDWRLGRFPNLMARRVKEILLVSRPYDSFVLEEDGLFSELISSEYMDLGLSHAPHVTGVSAGEEALTGIRTRRFDLVISLLKLGDMDIFKFSRAVHEIDAELPVVLLVSNETELARLEGKRGDLDLDGIYVWHGDAKLFLAIVKTIEDRWNAEHDTDVGGVGVVIVIEDSVRFRSTLLPIIYTELVRQTRSVMAEGINRMHKLLRLRARPKLLVAETYEQGMELYNRFREYLFGVITDVRFGRDGRPDPRAGLDFIRLVKDENPDIPCLLQSSDLQNRGFAESLGVPFLHKRSSTLLRDVQRFIRDNFGFGDFVFRLPDDREVGRASDLRSMVRALKEIPAQSLEYHALRNHFSNWLRARTEFVLARRLRPRQVSEFRDLEALRSYLITAFEEARRQNRRGAVEDFSPKHYDAGSPFARIGGGSLGGKARGLAFMDALLARHRVERAFDDVRIYVPNSVVIGTDVFDTFLEKNRLRTPQLDQADDEWILQAFREAALPKPVVNDLRAYLDAARYPIAVRSSSLLEDSQYHPFAGVYSTHMIANNHRNDKARLKQLCEAIKLVYASTFFRAARAYLQVTPYHVEEQKMGVILQQIVGSRHEHYFYPNLAGAVQSYNFYPFGHAKPEQGVACVALGLGKLVVEGGEALRFCPANPQVLPQLALGERFINQSQRGFYAVDLSHPEIGPSADDRGTVVRLDLESAESHGTLAPVGSTWSPEDKAFYDGIYRPGVRVVTFAHVLKSGLFPLADILHRVIELGRQGMGGPVEIEFAADLNTSPREFAVLQIRPHVAGQDPEPAEIGGLPIEFLVCYSPQAMGNGIVDGIRDIVYVKLERFSPAKTPLIAREVGALNEMLRAADRRYLLIGPGRWGSADPWLGIPVNWGQISAARIIVETSLENFTVEPSQGSHFFHNLTSFGVAYLSVRPGPDQGFVDWDWLNQQPVESEGEFVRHVRLELPLEARIDGRTSQAAVLKWSARTAPQ